MSRFWGGFLVATAVWAALGAGLYGTGVVRWSAEPETLEAPVAVAAEVEPDAEEEPARPRRRRRARRGDRVRTPAGLATTGDDLGEDGLRTIDMEGAGGEAQLSSAQIEAGFDSGMGRIRRCLVLMAGDDPVTGRITFGLRVAPSGDVRAVQLSGPAAATTGDAGDCLRQAARAIRFPAFDGPEMVVRYPLTLE